MSCVPWLLLGLAIGVCGAGDQAYRKLVFDSPRTSYNSCEKCIDYDGQGQCVYMSEGMRRQSICLPHYAREENCTQPNNVCGSLLCVEKPLEKSGKSFQCKLPDSKNGENQGEMVVFNETDGCNPCKEFHEAGDVDKTPGCLIVDNLKTCINPPWYEKAAEGLCDDALCPKYSRCLANERQGFYELRCVFDPTMLPKPPFVKILEMAELKMKEVAVETQVVNRYTRVLSKSKTSDPGEMSDLRESLSSKCQKKASSNKLPYLQDNSPFMFRQLAKKEVSTSEPQFTCLLREHLLASQKISTQLSKVSSVCVEPPEKEQVVDEKSFTRGISYQGTNETTGNKDLYIRELLEEATLVLAQWVKSTSDEKVKTFDEEAISKYDTDTLIEKIKTLLGKANEYLYKTIISATITTASSKYPKEIISKVEIIKNLMTEANMTIQKGLQKHLLGGHDGSYMKELIDVLETLRKKGRELMEALVGLGYRNVRSHRVLPQGSRSNLDKSDEKPVPKEVLGDPRSCQIYKEKEPTLYFMCNILCTQIQQFKLMGNIADKLGADKVEEKPCPLSEKSNCLSSDDASHFKPVAKLGDGNGNKEENITQQVSDDPKQEQLKPTDDDLKQKQLETGEDLSNKNDTGTSEMVHFRTGPDDLAPIVSGSHDDNSSDTRAFRGARTIDIEPGSISMARTGGSPHDNDWYLSGETTNPKAFRGAATGGLLSDVNDTAEDDYYTMEY